MGMQREYKRKSKGSSSSLFIVHYGLSNWFDLSANCICFFIVID